MRSLVIAMLAVLPACELQFNDQLARVREDVDGSVSADGQTIRVSAARIQGGVLRARVTPAGGISELTIELAVDRFVEEGRYDAVGDAIVSFSCAGPCPVDPPMSRVPLGGRVIADDVSRECGKLNRKLTIEVAWDLEWPSGRFERQSATIEYRATVEVYEQPWQKFGGLLEDCREIERAEHLAPHSGA